MSGLQRVNLIELELAEARENEANLRKLNASLMQALSQPSEEVARLTKELHLLKQRQANEIASFGKQLKETERLAAAKVSEVQGQLALKCAELVVVEQAKTVCNQQNQRLHRQLTAVQTQLQKTKELVRSQDILITHTRRSAEEQVELQRKACTAELNKHQSEQERYWKDKLKEASQVNKQNEAELRSTIRVLQSKLNYLEKGRELERMEEHASLRQTLEHIQWGSFSIPNAANSHGKQTKSRNG